jgi:hypothetical protein
MRPIRLLTSLLVLLVPAAPALAQDIFPISVAPNPNACGGFRPVTAQEAFEYKDQICKQLAPQDWGIWGIADGGAMGGPGYKCNIFKRWPAGTINGPTLCVRRPPPAIVDKALVARFAPLLKFDRAAAQYGLPMSPQPFYDRLPKDKDGNPANMPGEAPLGVENTDAATLKNGVAPTYYQVRTFGKQVRIRYWWFYGFQHACSNLWPAKGKGAHNGDWENVIVILREDRNAIAAVVYYQHGGWYTRIAGPRDAPCTPDGTGRCGFRGFRTEGEHPVVYAGRFSHGSFHDDNASGAAGLEAPKKGEESFWNCLYYADYRNPGSDADFLRTQQKLVDLDDYGEPWMLKDYWSARTQPGSPYPTGDYANWVWGPDGISNHPTQKPPPGDLAACEGSPTWDTGKDQAVGCYKSECYAGDDEASEHCLKECKPDYTNHGLTCWKSAFHLYGRLQGDHWYRYNYTLPKNDVGLSRRRRAIHDDECEWDAP